MKFSWPTYVINLARRKDRRARVANLVQLLNAKSITWINGVDGSALQKRAGRERHLGRNRVRLTYTSGNGKTRTSFTGHFGTSRRKMNPWGMMGCIMSHIKALEKAEKDLQSNKAPGILVLEDDAVASETLAQSKSLVQRVATCVASEYPQWKCVQLGHVPRSQCVFSFSNCLLRHFEVTFASFASSPPSFVAFTYVLSAWLAFLACCSCLLAPTIDTDSCACICSALPRLILSLAYAF